MEPTAIFDMDGVLVDSLDACIVIEDSIPRLKAGRAAGMPSVALVGTCKKDELVGQADHIVDHLHSISPARLREHLSRKGGVTSCIP